jgi:hypothetical protein
MQSGYEKLIDAITLLGLLGFPAYALYWFSYHFSRARAKRLWAGFAAGAAWLAATGLCFILPMLGCMGGGCAGKVSPFLELAITYVIVTGVIIGVLHRFRLREPAAGGDDPPQSGL